MRIYGSDIGRWFSVDPLAQDYPSLSAYNFVANTPLQAIDPDGNLIIFINGFWGFPTGACCGGTKDYWGNFRQKGKKVSWAYAVQDQIGDYNDWYIDGSAGGSVGLFKQLIELGSSISSRTHTSLSHEKRFDNGYSKGEDMAAQIIANLDKDSKGNIIESVKFVTNSMGAAYQRGFSQALQDYVDNFNANARLANKLMKGLGINGSVDEIKGFEVELVVDVAAFQGNQIGHDANARQNVFMRSTHDPVARYKGSFILNATEINIDKTGKPLYDHLYGWQTKISYDEYSNEYYETTSYKERHHASNFGARAIEDIPEGQKNSKMKNNTPEFEGK